MEKGYIMTYNAIKGYGFIRGVHNDYFFHVHDLIDNSENIKEDTPVLFDVLENPNARKPRAIHIKKV